MKAETLRKSILQYAIQGKLVPQIDSEEPASELVQKIKAEKDTLIKQGKIKEPKPLPPITEDEKPFDIPDSWEWVRLGNVGFTQTGNTPPTSDKENYGIDFPFVSPGDMSEKGITYINRLSAKGFSKSRLIPSGSVIMVCIGGSIGKCSLINREIAFNQQINSITPLFASSAYILFSLQSSYFLKCLKKFDGGTATPIVNKSTWSAIFIPLPPLEEQKRIVSRIEELMLLVDEYEKKQIELEKLEKEFPEKLKKSVLQYAIQGKLVSQIDTEETASKLLEKIKAEKIALCQTKKESDDIEKKFSCVIIENEKLKIPAELVCDFITKGTTPNGSELKKKGDIPFLKVYNIVKNEINFLYRPQYVSNEVHNNFLKRSKVYPNDVLINIVGPPLGKVAIVPANYPEWNINQAIAIFRSLSNISSRYLYLVLLEGSAINNIVTVGTAGQDNISLLQCKNIPIPLPPLEEQNRIVSRVEELFELVDLLSSGEKSKMVDVKEGTTIRTNL